MRKSAAAALQLKPEPLGTMVNNERAHGTGDEPCYWLMPRHGARDGAVTPTAGGSTSARDSSAEEEPHNVFGPDPPEGPGTLDATLASARIGRLIGGQTVPSLLRGCYA